MAVPKNSGGLTTTMFVCFRSVIFLLVANYECVDAAFMWASPPPAWNQTVTGTGGARTVVIQVRNGTTDYPLRWNYTLLTGQSISLTFFAVGDGTSQPVDIGFVVNPGGAGESTVINNGNDFQTRFRLQSDKKSSTLTIIKVNERENATFQCRVQVGANQWAYNVRIEVTVPPSITHISGNQTVTEGQNVTLICRAGGYPAPKINWTRLSDNSIVSKSLINVSRQDDGAYRCTADNGVGIPVTRDTSIVVHYKPDTVTLEANATENKDCSDVLWVNFTCIASEANPPVYNYQLFGNGDLPSPRGTWTQEISEKVPVQISANLITGSNTPRRGEDVALSCHASGFPEPSITRSKVLFNTVVEVTLSKWLNFTNITEDKSGMYICQANNTCGKRNSSVITIKVLHPPEDVILNASISSGKVCAAKMVKFTCKAGAAEPEVDDYTLYQNDTVIANMSGSGVFTLWLNRSGHFVYKCEAGNSEGTGTSNNITFTVEVPALVIYINDSIVIREGENATLSCRTTGFPPPSVSWVDVKTGVFKEEATLLLTNLTDENQGDVYKCVASNECGNDNKSTVMVVQHLPKNVKLNLSISDAKVCTGNMVQFTCKAGAANPKVERYTLYQNNTVIANMSSSGLSKLWLNTSGIFSYKCEAENSVRTETSNSISVTVEEGASVTSESGSIVVQEGDSVTISCNRSGVPLPNISWSYSRNDMPEFGSTLLVSNISRDLNGSAIECSASNACGNDSKPTYVIVQYAPENVTLSIDNLSTEVCPGNMVQFTCKAGAANPEVESYTLYRNNTEIENMRWDGVVTLTLRTPGQFSYRCVAENSVGKETSNNNSVTVRVPLSTTIASPTTVVKEGENVTLTCNVTGGPASNVIWVDGNDEVMNNGSIWRIPNISRRLRGSYSCVANDTCGQSIKIATIDVQYLDDNAIAGPSFSIAIGETVLLTCLAEGNPEPSIAWHEVGDKGTNSPVVGKYLQYKRTDESVSVRKCYTCVARNDVREVDVTVCLKFGVVRRITLTITNRNCKNDWLDEQFRAEVEKVLADSGLENVNITVRCGSVIVDLVLRFNQTVSETNVINTLKTAAREDKFGGFKVDPDSI